MADEPLGGAEAREVAGGGHDRERRRRVDAGGVRQSGGQPTSHGRVTKQGRAHARGMLVEAAWVAAKIPRPLRAFSQRPRPARMRGMLSSGEPGSLVGTQGDSP